MIPPTDQPGLTPEARILYDLVDTRSVTGDERPAAEVFVRHARALGLTAGIDEAGNAIADRAASAHGDAIHIALLGHIDTVPGYIRVRVEEGILHGRGSVDAKGPLATMLIAASRAQLPPNVRVSVAGAVGEEAAGSIGARHLAPRWTPDACVIGEPSGSSGITLGYKGRLLLTARAACPNAHSAGPQPSAPDELFAFWTRVQAHLGSFNDGRGRAFDRVQATLTGIDSTGDGLSQRARLHAGFRLPIDMPPDRLVAVLHEIRDGQPGVGEHLAIELRFDAPELAHATDRADPVVRALSTAIRNRGLTPRPKLKTGTCDMNVVAPIWRCPIAAYGPGDSGLDHTPVERIHLDEFHESIEILTRAIELLGAELTAERLNAVAL